jgi:hypothetical protein
MSDDLASTTISVARTQLHVREVGGNNLGPEVKKYQDLVHLHPGDAYCAAFACWCVHTAAIQLQITPQLRFSGGALHLWEINPSLQMAAPDVQCIGVIRHGDTGLGHIVLIDGLTSINGVLGAVQTIAGNTSAGGVGREGQGVFEGVKSLAEINVGFLAIR